MMGMGRQWVLGGRSRSRSQLSGFDRWDQAGVWATAEMMAGKVWLASPLCLVLSRMAVGLPAPGGCTLAFTTTYPTRPPHNCSLPLPRLSPCPALPCASLPSPLSCSLPPSPLLPRLPCRWLVEI